MEERGAFANASFFWFNFPDVQSNSFISGLFDHAAVACSPPVLLLLPAREDVQKTSGPQHPKTREVTK